MNRTIPIMLFTTKMPAEHRCDYTHQLQFYLPLVNHTNYPDPTEEVTLSDIYLVTSVIQIFTYTRSQSPSNNRGGYLYVIFNYTRQSITPTTHHAEKVALVKCLPGTHSK